ncbi:glycosyl hydrolase family 28-related protein [Klenkia sp. PcliD-1-E]|uniref:glycosyl hydrolase family 28-related protein n=1 Tax=Klenkia sp. PcliD-1-E TaxID=2954492 RepID=UPI002096C3C5|nr:right-handed parallel beta-helix repeat-containing protein [Klenkia sp. PcliD-1-E]MCO7220220.1 right-handed parallel beta-helix repeat-containing protein [Klenkia sp. PcliD-1-E]
MAATGSSTVPPTETPQDAATTARRRRRPLLVAAAVVVLLAAAGVTWWLVGRGSPDEGLYDPADAVRVEDFGAVGDGTTDDTAAVQAAFDAVQPGGAVLLGEGRTYAVSDVVTLAVRGAVLTGGGTLLATDEERSSLAVSADDVVVQDVTLTIVPTSRRFDAFEQQRLWLDGHRGVVVRDVTVQGSAAAGIYVYGTRDFVLDGVQVSGTRADGVHITGGASDGEVLQPVVRDVGDDGVAVVSYAQDGDPCAGIRVVSPVVDGTDARGISVVGGTDVTYTDITVSGTAAAGVYVAAETSYDTTSVDGVRVEGGSVTDANTDQDIDHGAVLVYNGGGERVVQDVTITGLELSGTRESASRWVGLISDGGGRIEDVSLDGLSVTGAGPGALLVSNSPATTFETSGWTQDGDEVTDPEQ